MKYIRLICLLFLAASFGCKSNPSADNSFGVIMPLALGNQWVYDDKAYDDKGHLIQERNDTAGIKFASVVSGETMYFDVIDLEYSHADFNKNDGLWSYSASMIGIDTALQIPYPAKVGLPLILFSTTTLVDLDTAYHTRLDTIQTVITLMNSRTLIAMPAGYFYCYIYQQENTDTFTKEVVERHIYYYVINVGKVYEEDYYSNPRTSLHLSNKLSLISYSLF